MRVYTLQGTTTIEGIVTGEPGFFTAQINASDEISIYNNKTSQYEVHEVPHTDITDFNDAAIGTAVEVKAYLDEQFTPSATMVEVDKEKPVHMFAVPEGDSFRARLMGAFNTTIPKGTTVDLDLAIGHVSFIGVNKQAYMDGIDYLACDAVPGDKMTFQVIDKDGLAYPAGTVLDEFGTDWGVFPDRDMTIKLYKAKMIPGMYIRIKYTSVGSTNDVKFICNLYRHMDTSEDI